MTWELTPELENDILTALENGVGLNAWCKVEGRPSRSTVLKWQRENLDFQTKCAHAREAAGELAAEKHNEVIEGCLSKAIEPDIAGRVLSGLQWRASKLASKKYGDSTTLKGDKENPLNTSLILIAQEINGRSTGIPEAETES